MLLDSPFPRGNATTDLHRSGSLCGFPRNCGRDRQARHIVVEETVGGRPSIGVSAWLGE
jgi:hypothetical protein